MTIVGNRITSPLTVANAAEDKRLEPIPQSPTGIALLPQYFIKGATILVGLATVGLTLLQALPPFPFAAKLQAIFLAIIGLGTVIGISSQGIRQTGTVVPAAAQIPANQIAPGTK